MIKMALNMIENASLNIKIYNHASFESELYSKFKKTTTFYIFVIQSIQMDAYKLLA